MQQRYSSKCGRVASDDSAPEVAFVETTSGQRALVVRCQTEDLVDFYTRPTRCCLYARALQGLVGGKITDISKYWFCVEDLLVVSLNMEQYLYLLTTHVHDVAPISKGYINT